MKLISIQYSQDKGVPHAWHLEGCTLDTINLIVGRNATGKTKTIKLIAFLADLLIGKKHPTVLNISFKVEFEDQGQKIIYELSTQDNKVTSESLKQNDRVLLERTADGIGKIWATKLAVNIDFQPPIDELCVVNRRDAIQHPFFENLYQWGKMAKCFWFGTSMGKDLIVLELDSQKVDERDSTQVMALFKKGQETYGEAYEQQIIEDMSTIGYKLSKIKVDDVPYAHSENTIKFKGILVKEKELNSITSYIHMSTGMFRALSLLIQINYSKLTGLSSCILIDDIGEGLDYSRSTALIKLLISKLQDTEIQLIMSTNDQFIMEAVPLKYWLVIKRSMGKAHIYNYQNSQKLFDDFKFTGLGNFDFFSSHYYLKEEE